MKFNLENFTTAATLIVVSVALSPPPQARHLDVGFPSRRTRIDARTPGLFGRAFAFLRGWTVEHRKSLRGRLILASKRIAFVEQ